MEQYISPVFADGPSVDEALLKALDAYNMVGAKSVPAKTISMQAGELQAYLNGLPRLLTEHLLLTVSGTLNTALNIAGFYGSGSIRIAADSDDGCTVLQPVTVLNCGVPIQFWNLQMTAPAGMTANSAFFTVTNGRYVRLWNCTLTRNENGANVRGITLQEGSRVLCEDCAVSGFGTAVFVGRMSSVLVYGSAGDYSGNTYGAHVWYGGTVMLAGSVPDTLGGGTNLKQGGMIVKADGTLL